MNRKTCIVVLCAGSALASSGSVHAALIANGTIAVADGTIIGTSGDINLWANATMDWSIDLTGGVYTYAYEVDNGVVGGAANISHFTVEVSDAFGEDDVLLGTTSGWELGMDGSSPDVDGTGNTLKGLKWQIDGSSFTATIVTLRQPVWGDVFIKDGQVDAANAGYFAADPIGPVVGFDITGFDWVGVPDTNIPTPGTLAIAGLSGLTMIRRRRK